MKQLNTLPIESFLEKSRIAIRSNQKNITLTIDEVTNLQNSLSVVMTRLTGEMDQIVASTGKGPTDVKIDGGGF
jgi:hypothetical protein